MKLRSCIICLLLMMAVLAGCSGGCNKKDEAEARKLYIEAYQVLVVGVGTEDPSERLDLFKKVLSNLDKILSDFPASQMAVDLAQGKTLIGSWTVDEFRVQVVPQTERIAKLMAEVEDIDEIRLPPEAMKGKPEKP